MSYENRIMEYLANSGGIITSQYCRENNIPTIYLSRLLKEGRLTKVKNGIYITEDGDYDEMFFLQYQYKKAIFSYESALFLLGVTDRIPWTFDVTVYNGYKFNEKPDKVNVNYVKKSIYDLGMIEKRTMYGNMVRTYSYERILCDFISNKDKMDMEVYVKIIRSYSDYKDKNVHLLQEISSKMGIENKVREIMEVVYK